MNDKLYYPDQRPGPVVFLGSWLMMLVVAACALIGAYQIGGVMFERAFGEAETAEVATGNAREITSTAQSFSPWLPNMGRFPSVQYVSDNAAVVRFEQIVDGERVLCTIGVDTLLRRATIAC